MIADPAYSELPYVERCSLLRRAIDAKRRENGGPPKAKTERFTFTPKEFEAIRPKALALLDEGLSQREVADRLGVSRTAVTSWAKAKDE
jgi:predicted DNA-binding protein (UPF0251 family)